MQMILDAVAWITLIALTVLLVGFVTIKVVMKDYFVAITVVYVTGIMALSIWRLTE